MTSKYFQGEYIPKNPQKYVGKKLPFARSSWETTVMQMFDNNTNIISWASEPIKIPYQNPFTGKYTVYVPDFIVTYKDINGITHTEIIEVKPAKEAFLEQAKSEKSKMAVVLNMYKWAAAKEYAKSHGITFRVMTEENIYNNPKRKA